MSVHHSLWFVEGACLSTVPYCLWRGRVSLPFTTVCGGNVFDYRFLVLVEGVCLSTIPYCLWRDVPVYRSLLSVEGVCLSTGPYCLWRGRVCLLFPTVCGGGLSVYHSLLFVYIT